MQKPIHRFPIALSLLLTLAACGAGAAGTDPTPPADDPDPIVGGSKDPTAPAATDIPLATFRLVGSAAGWAYDGPDLEGLYVQIGPEYDDTLAMTPLLTNDDMGREIEFRAGATTGLDTWFAQLANGADDRIGWRMLRQAGDIAHVMGQSAPESYMLDDKPDRLGGADLEGATLTRMVLHLERIYIANGPGYYDITFEAQVTIHGNLLPTAGSLGPIGFPADRGGFDR